MTTITTTTSTAGAAAATTHRVSVCGMGSMGLGMALRLTDLDLPVTVYNRTATKTAPAADAGATVAPTPAEAAAGADILVLSLSDEHAVRQVLSGPAGALDALAPGATIIDGSTTSAAFAIELAGLAGARGVGVVDACVIGNPFHTRSGEVRLVVGGDPGTVAGIRPLLDRLAKEVTHLGANGAASSMKLALNLVMGAQMAALAEAVTLAQAAGIDRSAALSVIGSSGYASPMLAFRCALADAGAYRPAAFRLDLMAKDLRLALDEAERVGTPLPATRAVDGLHRDAVAAGLGELDAIALLLHLETVAGLAPEPGAP